MIYEEEFSLVIESFGERFLQLTSNQKPFLYTDTLIGMLECGNKDDSAIFLACTNDNAFVWLFNLRYLYYHSFTNMQLRGTVCIQ